MRNAKLIAVAASAALMLSTPLYADPGHGHSDHGNGKHKHGKHQEKGGDNHVYIGYGDARRLAVAHGLTGYGSLPPGIAKQVARGKPLPPGIAKKAVPEPMLRELPHYPGYEWRIAGRDLVLIALSTAVVTTVINNVFD